MKIAKAILDEMDMRSMLDIYPQELKEAESIIAAKLEPVREVLSQASGAITLLQSYLPADDPDCSGVLERIEAALALFEEE